MLYFLKKFKKNTWRYHYFTPVYQKPQPYEARFLRYGVRQIFLSFWAIFHIFTPLTTQKIKTLKKSKRHLEMSLFCTCVPKIKIIWWMFPEIWNAKDKIFCHFGPFFALLPHYWPRKLKFWKSVKTPGDIIFLHVCTINEDQMMHVKNINVGRHTI